MHFLCPILVNQTYSDVFSRHLFLFAGENKLHFKICLQGMITFTLAAIIQINDIWYNAFCININNREQFGY